MHTRLDHSTDHLTLTADVRTTLEGHALLSEHPELWLTLCSRIRADMERALADTQHLMRHAQATSDAR